MNHHGKWWQCKCGEWHFVYKTAGTFIKHCSICGYKVKMRVVLTQRKADVYAIQKIWPK